MTVPNALEVGFTSKTAADDQIGDKKVIWKDILSEGRIEIAPIPGADKLPFIVKADGVSDPEKLTVSMNDLLRSYRDKAFKYVKIPDGHPRKGQGIANNTGFAEDLRIIKKNGKHYLQAALGFTEPDYAGKVRRGTIPDVSSGILLNYMRKSDGRTFPCALHHVALTGDPIMPDLDEFKRVYASDSEIDLAEDQIFIASAMFAEEDDNSSSNEKADVIWNEQQGGNYYREALQQVLNPPTEQASGEDIVGSSRPIYSVIDVARGNDLALVDEYYKGNRIRWVVPFTENDGKLTPAPAMRWSEGKEALIAAGDEVFGATSFGKVKKDIQICLETTFGEEGKKYSVQEASLNNKALIRDPAGALFLADYAIVSEGIFLSDLSEWEKKSDAPPPKPKQESKVVELFDESTPEGRVAAARSRRDRLWATK